MKIYSLHSFEDTYLDSYERKSILTEVPLKKRLLIRGADYDLCPMRNFEASDGKTAIIPIVYINIGDKAVHIEKGQAIAEGIKI